MTATTVFQRRRDHWVMPRFVLFGSLISAAIILGLLLMHGLNLHGTSSAHHAPTVASSHAAAGESVEGSSEQHLSAAFAPSGCEQCAHDSHHLGAAAACVLALFLGFFLFLLPCNTLYWRHRPTRAGPAFAVITNELPLTPSLHALCISRT